MIDSPVLPDEELVKIAKDGNQSAFALLLTKFAPIIRAKCKRFYKCGLEFEDFFQEGALGLFFAVKNYNVGFGVSFYTYAGVCIENRLLSLYKSASCQKNIPLNNYIPLYEVSPLTGTGNGLSEVDPEKHYIELENYKSLMALFSDILSEKERNVLDCYLQGYSYGKIAEILKISKKSVDNTIQRIKRKIKSSVFDR